MNERYYKIYNYFLQQGFAPADRNAYAVFREYEAGSILEERSAAIIASWSFAYKGLYKIICGYLCSVYFYEGKDIYFVLYPPLQGCHSLQKIIDMLYAMSMEAGLSFFQVKFIEEQFLPEYQAVQGYDIKTEFFDSDTEYIFRPADLLALSGKVNEEKRRHLRKCSKKEGMSLRPITNEEIHICSQIEEEWCNTKMCSVCASFTGCEKKALKIMVDIFDDRVYKGLYLYDGDKPVGYGIGEWRNQHISFLYYGKALIQDYFVYIIYKMVEMYFSEADYFNMSEDMGNMGLRFFKTHLGKYTPWYKYICTFVKKADV
jgi:hypothetical protein